MRETPSSAEAAWIVGLQGARANLLPGLALQALALAVGLAYAFHPPTRALLETLSVFRNRTGFLYSCISTCVFGGVLPCLYLKLRAPTRTRYDWAQNLGLCLIWAYKGIEVDLWYRFLAHTVGTEVTFYSVLIKMILDQFIYCPIWAVPTVAFAYAVVESGYNFSATLRDARRGHWYRRRVLPNLISNIGVWVPAVCVIYSLPGPLQIPLFNLVLCFYTLLLAHISARQAPNPLG